MLLLKLFFRRSLLPIKLVHIPVWECFIVFLGDVSFVYTRMCLFCKALILLFCSSYVCRVENWIEPLNNAEHWMQASAPLRSAVSLPKAWYSIMTSWRHVMGRLGYSTRHLIFFLFFSSDLLYLPFFSLPPSRNSDPGSHSRLFSPLPSTVCALLCSREKISALSSLVDSQHLWYQNRYN